MKRIVILGSTGSIGRSTLDVVSQHPGDFELVGLAARQSAGDLRRQSEAHPEAMLALTSDEAHEELLAAHPEMKRRAIGSGEEALVELIRHTKPDMVVNALVGSVGLKPTVEALLSGIPVAIANKEAIVTGGEILLAAARDGGGRLIPIDSEHVAISQCLGSAPMDRVERIVMTASGGALRDVPLESMDSVTVEGVLAHPTWNMGAKITVDSATLVNKGLEVIEARWLFGVPLDRIDVVIHPQSFVHSFVEFVDGSIIAQMGEPDMRQPILYALSYPDMRRSRLKSKISDFPDLTFHELDRRRYPCFELVLDAARTGGSAPTILNAANEVAVGAFLAGEIPFTRIGELIGAALAAVPITPIVVLDDILTADRTTREWIAEHYSIRLAG